MNRCKGQGTKVPFIFTMAQKARSEFTQALTAVAAERGIDQSVVLESIKSAIVAAYRRDSKERGEEVSEEDIFDVELNPDTGEAKVFKIIGKKKDDVTPAGFGRIAAQTAGQVIRQRIREAERENVLSVFEGKIGQLVSGVILRFDGQAVKVDLGKAEAIMPPGERVASERFEAGQRATFLLKETKEGIKGKELIVSRADPSFVKRLFEREVPELASRAVEIKAIARHPGVRTKIAVAAMTSGVDPVGSCVGQRGVRVQEVIKEIGGEKIDVIPWVDNPEQLITAALSPAQNLKIAIDRDKKRASVSAPQDQLSLVIGKEGQNVKLAAELTGYTIDVKGVEVTEPQIELEKIEKKPVDTETVVDKEAVTEDTVASDQSQPTAEPQVDEKKATV